MAEQVSSRMDINHLFPVQSILGAAYNFKTPPGQKHQSPPLDLSHLWTYNHISIEGEFQNKRLCINQNLQVPNWMSFLSAFIFFAPLSVWHSDSGSSMIWMIILCSPHLCFVVILI